MATDKSLSSIDVLSSDDRHLVIAGLEALLAAAQRARAGALAAHDLELVDLRDRRIATVSALMSRFR